MRRLGKLDIAVTIGTLLLSLWQMLLIDQSFVGFVIFWAIPPLLAVAANVFNGSDWTTKWASAYLVLMAAAQWIAATPAILPQFDALHPAATEFAATWNQLDVVTRRVISVNIALNCAFMFGLFGYTLGWLPIVHNPYQVPVPWLRCILALVTFWLLPGIGLLALFIEAVT